VKLEGSRSLALRTVAVVLCIGALLNSCQSPPPPAELTEIEGLLLALPAAWNQRDAEAWVANFDQDSGFTNILGMHFPDRSANEARHAELFRTIFANSTLSAEVLDIRAVGETGAVAELVFTLVGYERLPPGMEETEPGVLRTRLITVWEHANGVWRMVAAQNTAIAPVAAGIQ